MVAIAQGGPAYVEYAPTDPGTWRYYGGASNADKFREDVNRYGDEWQSRARAGRDWDEKPYQEAMGLQDQARADQQTQLGELRNLMDTSQSSAASQAVLAGGQQAAQGAQSLATVAKGGLVGQRGAMSQAQQTGGMVQQQAAQQAGIVRQQEAQSAALRYGQAASAMRAGDASARGMAQGYEQARADDRYSVAAQNAERERMREAHRNAIISGQQASMGAQVGARDANAQAMELARRGAAAQAAKASGAVLGGIAAGASAAGDALDKASKAAEKAKKDDEEEERQNHNYSDRELKDSVQSLSDRILSKTPGYSFHYKPGVHGEDPEKKNFGIMAQDLERTPEGASVVKEGPQGKMVDTGKLTLLHQAMMHDLNKRLRSLEKKR